MSAIPPVIEDTRENVEYAVQLMREHANEDYSLALARNRELTALSVGIEYVAHVCGLGSTESRTTLKESIVTAYLLGRADALNGE